MPSKEIKEVIGSYYTKKHRVHGNSHWGVDWNSIESQEHRFIQLSKVLPFNQEFSLIDYGCGYGALLPFLHKVGFSINKFTGYDISHEMISAAEMLYGRNDKLEWVTEITNNNFDFLLASGVFNVKLENNENQWCEYIIETINDFNKISSCGFSFNILTSYSDIEYRKDYLYYADPLFFFDYCKKKFSKNVALLHDYDLYEFTILVRK